MALNAQPKTPDVLSTWLGELRFRDAYVVLGHMGPGIAVRIQGEGVPTFHYVQRGNCDVHLAGQVFHLVEGDLLLMRWGMDRVVTRHPPSIESPLADLLRRTVVSGRIATFMAGRPTPAAQVLGVAACPIDCRVPALAALPPIAHLDGADVPHQLREQLGHLIDEASAGRAAAEPVVARLTELVVLLAARTVLLRCKIVSPMALAARDRQLSEALSAIHHAVANPWTVHRLARLAGMSRSAFAARFRQVLGLGPMQYVQRERMRIARALLTAGESVQAVSEAVGYASATSFSSAFRKVEGLSPSAVRRS